MPLEQVAQAIEADAGEEIAGLWGNRGRSTISSAVKRVGGVESAHGVIHSAGRATRPTPARGGLMAVRESRILCPMHTVIETPTFAKQADQIWSEAERLDFITSYCILADHG